MKTKQFECLLGGSRALNLSPDAMFGLFALARREAGKPTEADLLNAVMREASQSDKEKLARALGAAEGRQELN